MINFFLLGVISTASLVTGAFFLRFWTETRDPLFLGFSAAFLVEAGNRLAFALVDNIDGPHPVLYSIRLVSYLLILGAIAQKNLGGTKQAEGGPE